MEATDKRIVISISEKLERIIDICMMHSLEEVISDYLLSDALQFEYEKLYFDITKLSTSFYWEHKNIPIDDLRGIRNRVAHDYETVSIRILYDTAVNDLPKLKETLMRAIKEDKYD